MPRRRTAPERARSARDSAGPRQRQSSQGGTRPPAQKGERLARQGAALPRGKPRGAGHCAAHRLRWDRGGSLPHRAALWTATPCTGVRDRPRSCHGSPIGATSPRTTRRRSRRPSERPNKECLVLFGAAPPCQDFSPIGPGEGHQGARGRLFSVSAEFMQAIFDDLPGYNTASIFENVLMNSADAKTVMAHYHRSANGWGYVVRVGDTAWYDSPGSCGNSTPGEPTSTCSRSSLKSSQS